MATAMHNYDRDMGWASATTNEGQVIYSLLSNPGTRTPSINASTLAAYSRSARSIPELLAYRKEKGIEGEEVLDRIISDYNHDSVRGLGHLSVAMEGVDCITAMQFFYRHHIQDGQERSTRFQNFSKGRKYAPCPIPVGSEPSLEGPGYYQVLDYWLDGLEHFYPLVRAYLRDTFEVNDKEPALNPRTLDCVRYLVPMGISTSVGAIQSGREWSKWISSLHNDEQVELAQAFESVLRDGWDDYTPEGDVLIRHTEAWDSHIRDMMADVRSGYYSSKKSWPVLNPVNISNTFQVIRPGDMDYFHGADPLMVHLYLLEHPYAKSCDLSYDILPQLLTNYDWKHEVGPLGSSGLIGIHGLADLGTLKDLNRHRSCPSFIPLLHAEEDVYLDILAAPYSIHPYLMGTDIGDQMCEYIEKGYKKIREWSTYQSLDRNNEGDQRYSDWKEESISKKRAIKNLLPHAHVTPYVFYGSASTFITYIANLRTKPGGHMAYRQLAHAWASEVARKWPIWGESIPTTPTFSREEFIDRS